MYAWKSNEIYPNYASEAQKSNEYRWKMPELLSVFRKYFFPNERNIISIFG